MTQPAEYTPERRLLDKHPGVRDLVEHLPEFILWRAGLAKVNVDGEDFAVVGGDRLLDNDQLIVEWVRLFRPDILGGQ